MKIFFFYIYFLFLFNSCKKNRRKKKKEKKVHIIHILMCSVLVMLGNKIASSSVVYVYKIAHILIRGYSLARRIFLGYKSFRWSSISYRRSRRIIGICRSVSINNISLRSIKGYSFEGKEDDSDCEKSSYNSEDKES